MIQAKIFGGYFDGHYSDSNRKFIDADVQMNEFLAESKVEFIDAKYSTFISDGEPWSNILLIYKDTAESSI